jgi:protein-L-isoaspartate(D-aspartate) O-methyltransferase
MGRFEDERAELVEGIRSKGVRDERVLQAIGRVERHRFVVPSFTHKAYDDTALPIASGQTISQPYTVAVMTERLHPQPDEKVLEVGTGSGYQAAVLAELGCRVFTIERHAELHLGARRILEQLGYRVATLCGDGTVGWSEFAPYDGIIVTAAAPDVPQPLLQQLADGGRLVIPVGDQRTQALRILTREGDTVKEETQEGFKFVPLIGKKGWAKG